MLRLYSKDKCFYCKQLKKKLDEWGYDYITIRVDQDETAMQFMEQRGHKTVPQLYYNDVDVQQGQSTELTQSKLSDGIERAIWPNIDSGIE
jgi:glutaredoxin